MSDQENLAAQTTQQIKPDDSIVNKREEFEGHTLSPEQNAMNAHAIQQLRMQFTAPLNNSIAALDVDVQRIIESVDHARSTLPGSPNPADVGMSIIVKMGNIAKQIKENHVCNIIASCGSVASTMNLALEQAQRAQIQSLYSANAAQNAQVYITGIVNTTNDLKGRIERLEAIVVKIADKLEIELDDSVAGGSEPAELKIGGSEDGSSETGAAPENNSETAVQEQSEGGESAPEATQQA